MAFETRRAGRGILLGPAPEAVPYDTLLGAGTDATPTFVGLARSTGGGVARGVSLPEPDPEAIGIPEDDPIPPVETLGAILVGVFPSLALLAVDPFTGVGDPSSFGLSRNSSMPSLDRRTTPRPFRGEDLGEPSRDLLSK